MQIKDVMTREVVMVSPATTVADAATLMATLDGGPLPVCDGGQVMGLLTDHDLMVRAKVVGEDPHTATVRDVMTPEVVSVFEDQDVEEAMALMKARKLRHLVVLNRAKRLVGMVSLGDVAGTAATRRLRPTS
jgi:CBS domain-containing protein